MKPQPPGAAGKRVLFIAPQPFFQWRGSPIRVGFDALALAELGFEVDLLVMPVGEHRDIPGVRLLRIPNLIGARNVPIGPSPVKAILDVVLLFKALYLGFRWRYDVVHGVEEAGAIAVVVAAMTGGKVVFEKHSDPGSYRRGALLGMVMWVYRKIEAFSIRHADAVIGTGPALVEQARAARPQVDAHHIFDIPSSLVEAEPEEVGKARDRIARTGELLVTYVGSFAVYQGIELMFQSMPGVVATHDNVRFIIIGGTPEEIGERKTWLEDRGLADSVTFMGKIPPDDLPNVLAASDVLLSPRISGSNTPLKLLDYLKAGRAIVATDNEANRLILDEATAVLVEPTPEGFATGIGRLLDDEAYRARIAEEGRTLIRDTYNFEEFKRRLGVCYGRVLASDPSS